jgi:thioredoxin-related protein
MKKHILVLILLSIFNVNWSLAQETIIFNSYSDAIAVSKEQNKPLLVVLKAPWCKYCSILENDIDKFKLSEHAIICFIDVDKDKTSAKLFKYKVIPISFLIDTSNEKIKEISRKEGYVYNKYKEWLQSNILYYNDD